MKKSVFRIISTMILIPGFLLMSFLSGCGKITPAIKPIPTSLEIGYRRMFNHDRTEGTFTSFKEAVQKSGSITLSRLKSAEDTGEGYAIYTFQVIESLYNPDQDQEIYLYESIPAIADHSINNEGSSHSEVVKESPSKIYVNDSAETNVNARLRMNLNTNSATNQSLLFSENDDSYLPASIADSTNAENSPVFVPAYKSDVSYLLVLSRATDVYYPHPYFHNFNGIHIYADEKGSILEATNSDGIDNLKKDTEYRSYFKKLPEAQALIQSMIDGADSSKKGFYRFTGREIISNDPLILTEESDYIAEVKANKILYQNNYVKEVSCTITKPLKGIFGIGSSPDFSKDTTPPATDILPGNKNITILFPANLDIASGSKWLVFLYEDAEYRISSRYSAVFMDNKTEYDQYMLAVNQVLAVPATPEPVVLTPSPTALPKEYIVFDEYAPLVAKNDDVKGWFQLPGTIIDYPVLQSEDNDWYLSHNIEKKKSVSGSIVLDFRVDIKNLTRNTPVYGHNMKRGTMFHELVNYKSEKYFQEHPTITFNTLYEKIEWEVVAVYVVDSGYNYVITMDFKDNDEFQLFLDDMKKRSLYPLPSELSVDDQIMTLVTCSYEFDGARTVIQARRIKS